MTGDIKYYKEFREWPAACSLGIDRGGNKPVYENKPEKGDLQVCGAFAGECTQNSRQIWKGQGEHSFSVQRTTPAASSPWRVYESGNCLKPGIWAFTSICCVFSAIAPCFVVVRKFRTTEFSFSSSSLKMLLIWLDIVRLSLLNSIPIWACVSQTVSSSRRTSILMLPSVHW